MLKMYRPTAEQLLLLALYHQHYAETSPESMLERLRHHSGVGPSDQMVISAAKKTVKMLPGHTTMRWPHTVSETLLKGLAEEDKPRGDADLIDQMVRAIQLPHARNVLSGESMRRLRNAVLLPSELGGLSARLTAREMSCAQCGFPLHDRESVTMMRTGDGAQTIVCHRCAPPQVVPCASCEETASLSSKAMSAMSRMQCPVCSAKKAPAVKSPAPEEVELPSPSPFRGLSRGAVAVGAPPTTRPNFDTVTFTDNGINRAGQRIMTVEGINPNLGITDRVRLALHALRPAVDNGNVHPDTLINLGDGVLVNVEGIFSEAPR